MISLVLALVLAVGFVVFAVRAASRSTSSLGMRSALTLIVYPPGRRHTPAPVALTRLGGGAPVRVGGAVGHPTVVNFFASWCPICRQELGTIAAVARAGKVPFVGIDTDDDAPATALKLLRAAGATYPVGVGKAPLAEAYGTTNLPTTAFLNAKGQVVAIFLGGVKKAELTHLVAELAAGKPL